ncbi:MULTISPECIES: hypothetical protein [Bacillus subtilis group]|nr:MULTISPECIES: hypothetical protein [Bacillus subtilis group]MBO3635164.1 hypothetical protein [Bacillus subtilis]
MKIEKAEFFALTKYKWLPNKFTVIKTLKDITIMEEENNLVLSCSSEIANSLISALEENEKLLLNFYVGEKVAKTLIVKAIELDKEKLMDNLILEVMNYSDYSLKTDLINIDKALDKACIKDRESIIDTVISYLYGVDSE